MGLKLLQQFLASSEHCGSINVCSWGTVICPIAQDPLLLEPADTDLLKREGMLPMGLAAAVVHLPTQRLAPAAATVLEFTGSAKRHGDGGFYFS